MHTEQTRSTVATAASTSLQYQLRLWWLICWASPVAKRALPIALPIFLVTDIVFLGSQLSEPSVGLVLPVLLWATPAGLLLLGWVQHQQANLQELRSLLPITPSIWSSAEKAADLTMVCASAAGWIVIGIGAWIVYPGSFGPEILQTMVLAHAWAVLVRALGRWYYTLIAMAIPVISIIGPPGSMTKMGLVCALGLVWSWFAAKQPRAKFHELTSPPEAQEEPTREPTGEPLLVRIVGRPRGLYGLLLCHNRVVIPCLVMAGLSAAVSLLFPHSFFLTVMMLPFWVGMFVVSTYTRPAIEFALARPISEARLLPVPILLGGMIIAVMPLTGTLTLGRFSDTGIEESIRFHVRTNKPPQVGSELHVWQAHFQKVLRQEYMINDLPLQALQYDELDRDTRLDYLASPALITEVRQYWHNDCWHNALYSLLAYFGVIVLFVARNSYGYRSHAIIMVLLLILAWTSWGRGTLTSVPRWFETPLPLQLLTVAAAAVICWRRLTRIEIA